MYGKDMVLKIKSFCKRDWVCAVWIIFKISAKLIQQTDGQWQTSRNTAEDIDAVNDLVVSQEGAHETVASQQSWPQTCGLQDMVSAAGCRHAFYQKPVKIWWVEAASAWSMVRNPTECHWSVARTSLCVCVSKPKANTLNICRGVFVHNCQFVVMFNACISVVMNRGEDNLVNVLLQINSDICVPKIIKIEHNLTKSLRKVCSFFAPRTL